MKEITVTVDLDRLERFGGGDEPVLAFLRRVASNAATGGDVVWTSTLANVGRIEKGVK